MPSTVHTDFDRHYRTPCLPQGQEVSFQVVVEQTDLFVVAEKDLHAAILDLVGFLRGQIKAYITLFPDFLTSLTPIDVQPDAPTIIQKMAGAAKLCNVGPMAAVAGAIAQAVADSLKTRSPNLLVENGGDIFMHSTKDRIIGLLALPDQDIKLGLALKAHDFPCSLCSSSGTIGHSLSFGKSDLVAVRAKNGAFADAAATALANLVKRKADLKTVMARAKELSKHGLDGAFAQCAGDIAAWGQMELAEL